MKKRTNRFYTTEFKQEAVALVTEQGYSVPKAAASLGITDKLLYNWGFAPISPKCPTNHNYLIDFKEKTIHFFHPF